MSGEPAKFSGKGHGALACNAPTKAGPRATLGDLHRSTPWFGSGAGAASITRHWPALWLCPLGRRRIKRVLRERARCTACGRRGVALEHPGWTGEQIGFEPFPDRLPSA